MDFELSMRMQGGASNYNAASACRQQQQIALQQQQQHIIINSNRAASESTSTVAMSQQQQQHNCLSRLSYESGLAERLTDFTDGWSSVSSSARTTTASKMVVDVGNNHHRRLCHGVEAFEGAAAVSAAAAAAATITATNHVLLRHGGGHAQQQENSSSTSSEQAAVAVQHRAARNAKRKASDNSGKVSEGDVENNSAKCPKSSHKQASRGKCNNNNNNNNNNNYNNNRSNNNDNEGSGKSKSAEQRSGSEQNSGGLSPKSLKASSKLQDPHPKQDYIHVRARRGQATDSHSLAERVRREKISERMKFLQDLVPGCSKVTGKAVMLDEIINYVQSLQRQIEFLSMKLATVDPQLDINLETLLNKELVAQARSPETTLMGPDPAAGYREFQAQLHLQQQQQINSCNMSDKLRSVGTLCDAYLRSSMSNYAPCGGAQLAPLVGSYADSFVDPLAQALNGVACDGDLQTIVHMSNAQAGRQDFFSQGRLQGQGFLSPGFLKVEY